MALEKGNQDDYPDRRSSSVVSVPNALRTFSICTYKSSPTSSSAELLPVTSRSMAIAVCDGDGGCDDRLCDTV